MYSGGGGGRIYNPRPDPLERGPPKRVLRDETHIGEMVAASKKRISWRFTLGESDTVHEVVLTHSIMSYKKVSRAELLMSARRGVSSNARPRLCDLNVVASTSSSINAMAARSSWNTTGAKCTSPRR